MTFFPTIEIKLNLTETEIHQLLKILDAEEAKNRNIEFDVFSEGHSDDVREEASQVKVFCKVAQQDILEQAQSLIDPLL